MKTLSIQAADVREVAVLLDDAMSHKADTSLGMDSLSDLLRGAECFKVVADGKTVAAYAISIAQIDAGLVGCIRAAAGESSELDLTHDILPLIEAQFRAVGCVQIEIITRRVGLMKKLDRHAYARAAVVMRKNLIEAH